MVRQLAFVVALVAGATFPSSLRAQTPPRCLHGPSEQTADQKRRLAALDLAQQINHAESMLMKLQPGPALAYRPLAELSVPEAPAGFRLQFQLDGPRYAFSLKDTRDACHYAIFSDQDRWIYEATPKSSVKVVPADVP